MSLKYQIKETAPFVEFAAVPSAQAVNVLFDIVIDTEINLHNYCQALINKVFQLKHSQFDNFITHQCSLAKDPQKWLNKFEKLLSLNEDLFETERNKTRLVKLYTLIEKHRSLLQSTSIKEQKYKIPKKLINAESEERYFSYHEVKNHIATINEDGQKILYLTEEKFEYERANIDFVNQKLPDFASQCQKEIEQIYNLKKLKAELEKEMPKNASNSLPYNKVKFNCNVNQFVDLFYQLHRELFDNGKPIIDGALNDIVAIIVNSFVDKEGREISPETVKTILTPSKTDKRPKPHKRIDLEKLL